MANSRVQITKAQHAFLTSKSRRVLYVGGIGAGKTHILCERAIQESMKGRAGAIVGVTYRSLKDVIVPKFLERAEAQRLRARFKSGDMIMETDGGHPIFLRSGDRPDNLRGLNLAWAGMDEAAYQDEEVYQVLSGRMRDAPDAQMFFTTTPKGRGNWVYRLTQNPATDVITQSTFGNPFLPDGYLLDLVSQYTTKFAQQELYGDFVDMSGNLVEADWFKCIADCQANEYFKGKKPITCRFWDLAATAKSHGDYTVGLKMSAARVDGHIKYLVHDIKRVQSEWPEARQLIVITAQNDGGEVPVLMEQASMQKALYQDVRDLREMRKYQVKPIQPKGDKIERAGPWNAAAEQGHMAYVEADWNADFIGELISMTPDDSHEHDDQWDAMSGAYLYLVKRLKQFIVGDIF